MMTGEDAGDLKKRLDGVMKIVAEEAGETVQEAMKAARFGLDSPGGRHGDGPTAREGLVRELGDMAAATDIAIAHGFVSRAAIDERRSSKYAFLMGPDAVANNGDRLAPLPPGREAGMHLVVAVADEAALNAATGDAAVAASIGISLLRALAGDATRSAVLEEAGIAVSRRPA